MRNLILRFNKPANYVLIILLALITFGVFANTLHGDFLIDDKSSILDNERIHDIKRYFSKDFKIGHAVLYEALRAFHWHIAQEDPFYYHLFNILFHIICVLLIYVLCNELFHSRTLSFLSSLIFAVHPIHTEAVSWISGGHYVFSSVFFIASMLFYIKSDKTVINLILSIVFFVLCFLSGNSAATLPIMFILFDLFLREKSALRSSFNRLRMIILLSVIPVSALIVWIFFVNRNKLLHLIFYYRGFRYLIVAAKALVYYLKILYLPLARGLYHPFAFDTAEVANISPAFFLSLAIVIISAFAFFKCRKSLKPVSFGIMWFFVAFAPYSNVVPICNIISERYLYLASAGFAIILACFFLKVWEIVNRNIGYRRILRIASIVAITLFLGSYSALTLKRNYEYNNVIVFWESNICNFPNGHMFYNNLAGTYYVAGNLGNAIAYCRINLMINPAQPHVWCNLAKVYREIGDLKQAAWAYSEAIKVDDNYFPAIKALKEIDESSR